MKKLILILLCGLLIPWSAEAKDKTINLQYIPREKVKFNPKIVSTEKIFFEAIIDSRSQSREIGENIEDKKKPIKILTSREDGAVEFLLLILKKEFNEKGFKIETNPSGASKIISTTLLKFWTEETSTYNTEMQLRIEVKDKQGEPFFKKTYASASTNRGRSLSDGNYNECFSDALARIGDQLFSDLELLRGLAEKPKPPKVEAKPREAKPIESKSPEEKRLEEIRSEIKKLEELKTEEERAKEKQEAARRAEEKRLEEKRIKEKQEAERRAEEKRLEELKEEVKRLEKFKADEKRALEKHEEEKKAEEKRLEELKAEVKKLEEIKALKEEILAEEKRAEEKRAEEKKKEEEKKAKEKRAAPPRPRPAEPVFGPK